MQATPIEPLRYRGRALASADIESIRQLIAANPTSSRHALSWELCRIWDWKQPNGALCDAVCRGLMLMLHRAGMIELPAVRNTPPPRSITRQRPEALIPDNRPVNGALGSIGMIGIEQVRRSPNEALFNSLMAQYHYLGYEQPVGEHLKYLVTAGSGQAIACLAWSSAPRHIGCRDRFIGWDLETRKRNIGLLAYNTRFLILPWVRVPHLASHLLGSMAARIAEDWQQLYAHPVYMLETFVDPTRFRGTCYRAANWIALGRTTGRGKNDLTHRANRSEKEVLVYPLHRRFRERLMQ
jgi:hypothetical protein